MVEMLRGRAAVKGALIHPHKSVYLVSVLLSIKYTKESHMVCDFGLF